MARQPKPSVDERLARFRAAQDVNRVLRSGVDRLPVSDLTRTILKVKGGELVAGAAETAAALAEGASVGAQDGVEAFRRSRRERAAGGSAWSTSSDGAGAPPTRVVDVDPAPSSSTSAADEDLIARLERLSRLHDAGHLDDREYQAAKAKVLGLDA